MLVVRTPPLFRSSCAWRLRHETGEAVEEGAVAEVVVGGFPRADESEESIGVVLVRAGVVLEADDEVVESSTGAAIARKGTAPSTRPIRSTPELSMNRSVRPAQVH